ncbi:MAG: glycosyltransferase, partial [Chloroflexota bacterium]
MRVLMLAIRYDTDDWATGFIPDWATRLAAELDHLDVLALEVGKVGTLPDNLHVYSMGREDGLGRAATLARFYWQAARLIPRTDAIFVHMIPRYALLAAPLAIPLGKSMTLWYTHRNASNDLRRALPLVRRVVTAVGSSFPLETDKLQALGHGVDTAVYTPQPNTPLASPPEVLHVARLQAIKGQDVLIAAMRDVPDARAVIVGDVPAGEDDGYAARLRALANPLGEQVVFTGGLAAAA